MDDVLSPKHTLRRTRRIACDVCRERKVRCDRRQPSCERCIRLGNRCTYTVMTLQHNATGSGDASIRIHKLLLQMQSRLARAELQLAKGQSTASYPIPDATATTSPPYLSDGSGTSETLDLDGPALWDSWRPSEMLDSLRETPTDSAIDVTSMSVDELMKWSNSAIGSAMEESSQRQYGLSQLYSFYFETAHPILPMLDRERFEAEANTGSDKSEAIALRHAVAMAGAASRADGEETAEHYYTLARSELEQLEQKDTDETFLTISALQALILVVFYEFKRKSLARTWMTVGRCMRLTRALDLHRLDCEVEPGDSRNSILSALRLSPSTDLLELEERRSTFWCAYIIDSYVSALTGCATTFNEFEITCFLPRASPSRAFSQRDRLQDVINDATRFGDVSSFRGFAIMAALAGRVSMHCSAAQEPSIRTNAGYPFWNEHFRLTENVSTISDALLSSSLQPPHAMDVRLMLLALNMHAVTILLHDFAIERSTWEKVVPAAVIAESRARTNRAAKDIIAVLRRASALDSRSKSVVKQMNTFNMWSLSVAAKVITTTLNYSQDPLETHEALVNLHVLHSAVVEFEDRSVFFKTFLKDITMHLSSYNSDDIALIL